MLLSILFILPSVEYLILSIPKIEKDWSARRKKTHSSKSQASESQHKRGVHFHSAESTTSTYNIINYRSRP